jgi:hypothetical protein
MTSVRDNITSNAGQISFGHVNDEPEEDFHRTLTLAGAIINTSSDLWRIDADHTVDLSRFDILQSECHEALEAD